ncbi:MAG: RNA 2',3'-cyclic phosphodiesterase [Gammaproteobacteria bacterium]|nr:RNA 2',3'-cyclic phosphodiesterase [Gammaproteobacteria bacterium]
MSNAKKRLFFALWPDQTTRQALTDLQATYLTAGGARAVSSENLHVTLAFLHSIDIAKMDCIVQAARNVRVAAFAASFSVLSVWEQSRICWLGQNNSAAGSESLQRLAQCLWAELASCGLSAETRRYTPHITLAKKITALKKTASTPEIIWHARDFVLVESRTGGRQSRYEVLQRFPLIPPTVNPR